MFETKKAPGSYSLVSITGRIESHHDSITDALRHLMPLIKSRYSLREVISDEPGEAITEFDIARQRVVVVRYVGSLYSLRDNYTDSLVALGDIRSAWLALKGVKKYFRASIIPGQPVPGIHKRSGKYRYYRRIGTYQIHRQSIDVDQDEPPVRVKVKNRPSVWDDIPRLSKFNNNWKRYRKTQYK